LRRFWAALTFYTALPLGRAADLQFEGIAAWLPAVGLCLGGILFLASLLLQVFPAGVRAALLVALWVVLTGGLHLDGVADTADGLAANLHTSPEQSASNSHRLQVMSDSHTGAYGVLALGLVLLLKFAALSSLQVWPLLLLGQPGVAGANCWPLLSTPTCGSRDPPASSKTPPPCRDPCGRAPCS
jgi:adenosylcobinamide-GDP ribazoletransferase